MAKSDRAIQVAKLKGYLDRTDIQERFFDIMSKQEALQFMATMINEYSNNPTLLKCTPKSVIGASLVSASLDLPVNSNLGFAYLVPYKNKGVYQAQLQIGYKGMTQLALRTGEYKTLNVVEVYQNQFTSFDRKTEELIADFTEPGKGEIIGYAGYLKLLSGFEKTVFWTKDEVESHAKQYSIAYSRGYNTPWKSNFDAMAKKTVLKNMISKWGIMTIKMQMAQTEDQKVFDDIDKGSYGDNPENAEPEGKGPTEAEKEFKRKQKEKLDAEAEDVTDYKDVTEDKSKSDFE